MTYDIPDTFKYCLLGDGVRGNAANIVLYQSCLVSMMRCSGICFVCPVL